MDSAHFKNTFHFIPDGAIPLYNQLAAYIKLQIQAGVYKPGEMMIPETELCTLLNVSRTTVRQSMNLLLDEGLIVRFRGKGSFIAEQKLRRNINYMYNFTESIRSLGATPGSVVLTCAVEQPDKTVRERLRLAEGADVFTLTRLRCANGTPLLLETSYIPYYLCPGIETLSFVSASLYNTLANQYGLNLHHAEETIEAIIIDRKTAAQMQITTKMPGYRIERLSTLSSGQIFEYTRSITRADKCLFRLELNRSAASGRHTVDFERQISAP